MSDTQRILKEIKEKKQLLTKLTSEIAKNEEEVKFLNICLEANIHTPVYISPEIEDHKVMDEICKTVQTRQDDNFLNFILTHKQARYMITRLYEAHRPCYFFTDPVEEATPKGIPLLIGKWADNYISEEPRN